MKRFFRRFHKWLGLIVGLQILAWTCGGFVMSFFPIEKVRGEHNIRENQVQPLSVQEEYVSIHQILAETDQGAELVEIKLKQLAGRTVYEVLRTDGQIVLYSAKTGELLSPLSRTMAVELAKNDFKGSVEPISVTLLKESNLEYRKEVPVWQVILDDAEDTHLYISPFNGEILARRNNTWRLFDFFWMLHIMDYKYRTDFNHLLLIVASILAVSLVVSGLFLLAASFNKRDLRYLSVFIKE